MPGNELHERPGSLKPKFMNKVLIVEDDAAIARVYGGLIRMAGCEVTIAVDGDAALESLGRSRPDLVLLDLMVPKKNGVEVLKFIRATPELKEIPVIVFTNACMGPLMDEAVQSGATQCLVKAQTAPKQLIAALKGYLKITPSKPAAAPAAPAAPVVPAAPAAAPIQLVPKPAIPPAPALAAAPAPVVTPAPASAPAAAIPFAPAAPTISAPPSIPASGLPLPPPPAAPPPEKPAVLESKPEPVAALPIVPVLVPKVEEDNNEPGPQAVEPDCSPELLSQSKAVLASMRAELQALAKEDDGHRLIRLTEMQKSLQGLSRSAQNAGLLSIVQLSSASEQLLKEIAKNVGKLNPSVLRTAAQGLDCLDKLFSEATKETKDPGKTPFILVLDDDAICRRLINSALQRGGLRALKLDDPTVALKVIQENSFDMAFLDVMMPGMDGFELCKKLRASESNKTTPVVFVTALSDLDTRAQSILSGGNDFIGKPFIGSELIVKALVHILSPKVRSVSQTQLKMERTPLKLATPLPA